MKRFIAFVVVTCLRIVFDRFLETSDSIFINTFVYDFLVMLLYCSFGVFLWVYTPERKNKEEMNYKGYIGDIRTKGGDKKYWGVIDSDYIGGVYEGDTLLELRKDFERIIDNIEGIDG